jgi:hypothetical protein
MRTTLTIDDGLYRRAKARAAETGRSVGELIEDALRQAFDRPSATPSSIEPLPTFGGEGVVPGVDLSSNASIAEVMDEGTPLDALR